MLALAASLALAAVLVAAALAKLARPRRSQAALATYGFVPGPTRWTAWAGLIAIELGLAAGVVAGSDSAAYAAAALMTLLALTLLGALLRGRAGEPCACLGAGSKLSGLAVGRNLLLAAGFAALPALSEGSVSTDARLAVGLGVALLAGAALAVGRRSRSTPERVSSTRTLRT